MPSKNAFVLSATDLKKLKWLGFGKTMTDLPKDWICETVDKRDTPSDPNDTYRTGLLEHHYFKKNKLQFVYSNEYTYYDGSYAYIEWK